MSSTNGKIVRRAEEIGAAEVEAFRKAIGARAPFFPPTFATLYRHTEFEWLARLGLKLENVLHTEQEYQYVEPLKVGDEPFIETEVKSHRERRGMHFLTLETAVVCNGVKKISAISSFVIRTPEAAK